MRLAICDELGNRMSVFTWTPLLLASYDAYQFADFFLTPTLKDLSSIPNEPLAHFSPVQMNWIQNEHPPSDWFIGHDFPFVQVHGFSEDPFCLPTYVTEWTLTLKIMLHLVRIERAIGSGKHDTSITEDHNAIGPIILVWRNIAKEVLMSKMAQLSLVVIDDSWSYDLDGCLNKIKNVVKHEPHN